MKKKAIYRKKHSKGWYRILFLRNLGNLLIVLSFFIIIRTFYQPVIQEFKFYSDQIIGKKYSVTREQITKKNISSIFNNKNNNEILSPVDPYFSIIIPKIAANSKIFPNVNPGDENIYLPILQKGVAHAEGSAFPGEGGHIFLFAHSTDYFWNVTSYNAVFYMLYKLEKNDEIDLFFKNHRIVYKVVDKKVVNPSEVEYLTKKTDKEFLTLQTCWPLGTTLQRLLVFAERVSN